MNCLNLAERYSYIHILFDSQSIFSNPIIYLAIIWIFKPFSNSFLQIKELHTVKQIEKPIRLQEYGVGIFKSIPTKSALKKAIKKKLVFVNNHVATTAIWIQGGETIAYVMPEERKPKRGFILPLKVVFEDDYIAILEKPPGVLVSGNGFKTITNALAQNLQKSSAHDAISPQPAHRLDFPTTGLLVVGKTQNCLIALNLLFQQKKIEKVYYAVTIGTMPQSGCINSPIDSQIAVTDYEVVQSLVSERFGFLNLVKLNPKTGKRHQLRKHLFSLGNPILGDPTYFLPDLNLKGKGLYLHAQSVDFLHPITNSKIRITSNLPLKFRKLFGIDTLNE